MNCESERQSLLTQIEELADPTYQSGAEMVMRTSLKMYGVRVPDLRGIAKRYRQAHKKIELNELMDLVKALWNGDSQEERALAMELLRQYRRAILHLTWNHFDRWRYKVDNWGLTDLLGTKILAPWLQADPVQRLGHLEELVSADHLWSRRLALVATVPINRSDPARAIPERTLALIDRVKAERDPMITKAISWALRELSKTHPARVAAYVEANRNALAAHVVREVNNKLQTGLKSGQVRAKGE